MVSGHDATIGALFLLGGFGVYYVGQNGYFLISDVSLKIGDTSLPITNLGIAVVLGIFGLFFLRVLKL